MSKKWLLVMSSGALVALLLVGLAGGTLVFAQDTDPTTVEPGAGGRGDMLGWGGGSWTQFDTAAETLGLTPNELFIALHDEGKTLAEAQRESIAQAVEDGTMTQDEANWLLEGLEKGFTGGGHGMGPGGFGGHGAPGAPAESTDSGA